VHRILHAHTEIQHKGEELKHRRQDAASARGPCCDAKAVLTLGDGRAHVRQWPPPRRVPCLSQVPPESSASSSACCWLESPLSFWVCALALPALNAIMAVAAKSNAINSAIRRPRVALRLGVLMDSSNSPMSVMPPVLSPGGCDNPEGGE